jgi:molybdate transport system substrate-binding protein
MRHSAVLLPIFRFIPFFGFIPFFKLILLVTLSTSARASDCANGGCLTIAAAASLKPALEAIRSDYLNTNPSDSITLIFGSSTKLRSQIEGGAPFEIFFSADMLLLEQLIQGGHATSPAALPFASGRIVLWLPKQSNRSRNTEPRQADLVTLQNPEIRRIAIANPVLAPYGMAAQDALRAAGVWESVKTKMVYGQDVGQAAQFVATGNAQAGIIALSLALSPQFTERGNFSIIPSQLHRPLAHGFIVTKKGATSSVAARFRDWILGGRAKARLKQNGLEPQSESTAKRRQNATEGL